MTAALEDSDVAGPASVLELDLFPDRRYLARRTRTEQRGASRIWSGTLDGVARGVATFVSTNGIIAGTVFTDTETYEIGYAGDGMHEITQLDPRAYPEDEPVLAVVQDQPDGTEAPAPGDPASQVDVMVAWTPAARVAAGGASAIRSTVELAVFNANTAYEKSGVMSRLHLVYAGEVAFTESDIYTDLTRFARTDDGIADGVHALRDRYGADLVSLIGSGYTSRGSCGIAYLMGSPSTSFAASAFSVVDWSCAAGNLSLAHELGHNEGLNHDPANASGQGAYPYAFGFQDPAGDFRTIMAYGCDVGAGCPRKPLFSSPALSYNGTRAGTQTQDNVRALNNTGAYVANFRQAVATVCSYSLDTTAASFGSAGGSGSVAVAAGSGCAWSATSGVPWITIAGGGSGTGNGSVGFSVAGNTVASSRTGTLTIAGVTFTVTQAAALPPPPAGSQTALEAARSDFNGDFRPDLIWRRGDGLIEIWMMNGLTAIDQVAVEPGTVDPVWRIAGTGDIDGDGIAEIIWQHRADGWLCAWFMTGAVLKESVYLNPTQVGNAWKIKAVADMNGDGRADLIWQHDLGWLCVWYMNGVNLVTAEYFDPARIEGDDWKIVGAADMNGDGRTDLVWQHTSGGWLCAWLMNGRTLIDAVYLTPAQIGGTDWKIRAVQDVNGDGQTDLVWQHQSGGWVSAWLMNGTTAVSTPYLTPNKNGPDWQLMGPK